MPYPPPTLPTSRSNATPQQDVHPADHNAVNAAVNDIVAELGTNPGGQFNNLSARFAKHGASLIHVTDTGYSPNTLTVVKNYPPSTDDSSAFANNATGVMTIPLNEEGWYSITVTYSWRAPVPTGYYSIILNNQTLAYNGLRYDYRIEPGGAGATTLILPLSAGMTVDFRVYVETTAATLVTCSLRLYRIGNT